MLPIGPNACGLAPEIEGPALRAGLRSIPAGALCWNVAERVFDLRNGRLQRLFVETLAHGFERLAEGESGPTCRADRAPVRAGAGYQAMAEASLLRIARGADDAAVLRLAAATLRAAGRLCPGGAAPRLVDCLVELAPREIEVLRLFAMEDGPGPPQTRVDLVLGRRSAGLGSEREVEAAAEHLRVLGLLAQSHDIAFDTRERSLMPRDPTELGWALLDLVRPAGSDVAYRAERRAGHVLRVQAQGR